MKMLPPSATTATRPTMAAMRISGVMVRFMVLRSGSVNCARRAVEEDANGDRAVHAALHCGPAPDRCGETKVGWSDGGEAGRIQHIRRAGRDRERLVVLGLQ